MTGWGAWWRMWLDTLCDRLYQDLLVDVKARDEKTARELLGELHLERARFTAMLQERDATAQRYRLAWYQARHRASRAREDARSAMRPLGETQYGFMPQIGQGEIWECHDREDAMAYLERGVRGTVVKRTVTHWGRA